LGPDLAGVARRFSREDLFTAIAIPNRDVSPRYQTTLIQTIQGKVYTGLVIYQSVDGLILRNATNQTFRIEADDIEIRRTLNASLMPAGLLNDLKPRELADLYAYIRSLGIESSRSK
jgi:putative heme-binding domain-containing protein